jgi:hypothetical protein
MRFLIMQFSPFYLFLSLRSKCYRQDTVLQYRQSLMSKTKQTKIYKTECRDRVVNTPASYSCGRWFKSGPGDRLSRISFRVFPQSLQANTGIVP